MEETNSITIERKDYYPYQRWAIYIPLPVTYGPCKSKIAILEGPSQNNGKQESNDYDEY